MTEKYEQVIFNLTEILKSKNLDLYFSEQRIKDLEKKLEQAEREIE